jgi:hypothetical protein
MRKADYQDASRYTKAEWRSGIDLENCTNVILRHLTVAQTGGDGLYLGASDNGYNKNVLVDDMIFDDNHRQGVSVISVDGLTIRNSKFTNTSGTAPQAGIDFEPNSAGQRLANCVIEDSTFTNNQGDGIDIYAVHLNSDSQPISIHFNRCFISGNLRGGFASAVTRSINNPVTGTVTFNECKLDGDSIRLGNAILGSVHYLFKNCTLDFSSSKRKIASSQKGPIILKTDTDITKPVIGNIVFDNVNVIIDKDQTPLKLDFWGETEISDQINGFLNVKQDRKNYKVELPDYIQQNRKQLEVSAEDRLRDLIAQLPRRDNTELQKIRERINALEKAGSLNDNIIKNGDFASQPSSNKTLSDWSTWQASDSNGTFDFDEHVNHGISLGGSAVLSGAFNGCFIQNIKVKPGETYVIQGWLRRAGLGVGSLKAGWKTADNKWINDANGPIFYAVDENYKENTWQKIEGIVTAPENAGILSLLCCGQYQRLLQDQIWFDDIAVFNIATTK